MAFNKITLSNLQNPSLYNYTIKGLFVYLFVVLGFMSCHKTEQYTYVIEDEIYSCLEKQAAAKGINLDQKIVEIESILISNEVLRDQSGEAYLAYLMLLSDTDTFESSLTQDCKSALRKSLHHFPFSLRCHDAKIMDSIRLRQSRFYQTMNLFKDIEERVDLSMQVISASLANNFTSSDLDHKLYKHYVLSTTLFYMGIGGVFEGESNKAVATQDLYAAAEPKLNIVLTKGGEILLDSTAIAFDKLRQNIKHFLKKEGRIRELEGIGSHKVLLGKVRLSRESAVKHQNYKKVYLEMMAAYRELKNEYSEKIYHKAWDDLNREEQQNISKIIPENSVGEAVPY